MRRHDARSWPWSLSVCVLFVLSVAAVMALGVCASMGAQGPVDEVDPTIGNVSILLEPTRPTAYLPNSMVRMYPMRKDALDDQIQYFPLTILSHRQPELFAVMPGGDKPAVYDAEHAMPYFYSTRFDESMIRTSLRQPTRLATSASAFRTAERSCM